MAELPTGTVTFLFTDIEGSTRLLARLRDGYADVLSVHHRVIREALAAYGGREVHTEGDAFFAAFARAGDALAAAVRAQRALAAEAWPGDTALRVRMGLHTGDGTLRDGDYVGLDVHRAARICAAAHGGQVLLSRATRGLVEELPPDVALRGLGEHRLKDLERPEELFQAVAGDLPAEFPPVGGGAAGIPPSPNRTIGREPEIHAIAARLTAGEVRLLTLTGPGGVGKTRLALEAARAAAARFGDGARFVPLAPVPEPDDVPGAIVAALAIPPVTGETAAEAVLRFLSAKRVLLVLDNFEHVLPAASLVSDLLAAGPGVTILATSREPLALHTEERFLVEPLAVPEPGAWEAPSVALFCERAGAAGDLEPGAGDLLAVAGICRRLDGLPLAIELAAARSGLLAPAEIAQRLDAALGALGEGPRDAPARQKTLRATIDWSHDLLDDDEQRCFARFAVFAGGATVDAAERVTGASAEVLEHLVAKSLLVRRRQADGASRLLMLETVRAYAGERFSDVADADAVRARHYDHYRALAEIHGAERALWGMDGNEHLAVLDAEVDNLHAALGWAVSEARAAEALAMCDALGDVWLMRDRYADALHWIDQALRLSGAEAHAAPRVRLLCVKAWALWPVGRGAEQHATMAEAEATARALGDPVLLSRTLEAFAEQESSAGHLDRARSLADEALCLAVETGDEFTIAMAANGRAMAAQDPVELRRRVEHAASLLDAAGNVHHVGDMLAAAAYVALQKGSDADAMEYVHRAIPVARELDNPYTSMLLRGNLGLALLFTGQTEAAGESFREELRESRRLVVLPFASEGLHGLAAVAAVREDDDRAARLAGAAAAHRYSHPEDAIDARLEAAFFGPARARCGDAAWQTAAREGAALSFEDAIAYALGEVDRRP